MSKLNTKHLWLHKKYKLQHKTENKLTAINLQSLWVSRGDGLDIPSLVSTT